MTAKEFETHIAGLTDLPLVRRLIEHSIPLDNEAAFTADTRGAFSHILLPSRGSSTLVARNAQTQMIGQFKLRYDEPNAHVIYVAPKPEPSDDTAGWLHVLDGMAREAGKLRAHALVAEVEEDSPLFETMRMAGFAVYCRQQLWHRNGMYSAMPSRFKLREEDQHDLMDVQALMNACIPKLIQQFTMPPGDMPRLVYREQDRILAYVAYSMGRRGVYVLTTLHSDVLPDAAGILDAALQMIAPAAKMPITFCVRRYQDWLGTAMERLGFEPGKQQALMVRHIAVGVRQAQFEALDQRLSKVRARTSRSHHITT